MWTWWIWHFLCQRAFSVTPSATVPDAHTENATILSLQKKIQCAGRLPTLSLPKSPLNLLPNCQSSPRYALSVRPALHNLRSQICLFDTPLLRNTSPSTCQFSHFNVQPATRLALSTDSLLHPAIPRARHALLRWPASNSEFHLQSNCDREESIVIPSSSQESSTYDNEVSLSRSRRSIRTSDRPPPALPRTSTQT